MVGDRGRVLWTAIDEQVLEGTGDGTCDPVPDGAEGGERPTDEPGEASRRAALAGQGARTNLRRSVPRPIEMSQRIVPTPTSPSPGQFLPVG